MTEQLDAFLLEPLLLERVWGRRDLTPWFAAPQQRRSGEAWLTAPQCRIASGKHTGTSLSALESSHASELLGPNPAPVFPLLIKLLFPQEKLSVQVHPDDAHAAAIGGVARAKTECWYVLDAEPGASVALGFRNGVTLAQAEAALGAPALEHLMHFEQVEAGDTVFVDAGTVHAIGPGVTLLEVQQPSDTTYRLWDYGRPRELHLDHGRRVTKLHTRAGKRVSEPIENGLRLITEQYFILERFELTSSSKALVLEPQQKPECIVSLAGSPVVSTTGSRIATPRSHATVIPASVASYRVEGEGTVIRCRVPA